MPRVLQVPRTYTDIKYVFELFMNEQNFVCPQCEALKHIGATKYAILLIL